MRLLTIGAYGFDEPKFLAALRQHSVDAFADIRQRRGVRGSTYAFVNSTHLQRALGSVGVRYIYIPELAPTTAIRDRQKANDAALGVLKRDRSQLSPDFVDAYHQEVLAKYDASTFQASVGPVAAVALFCVERTPQACHRSLAAQYIGDKLGISVEHVIP